MKPTTPTYTYHAVTITPLHIGSGERLREGFDFISHGKYLWIPHQGRLLGAILDEAAAESGKDLAQVAGAISEMTLNDLRQAGWLKQDIFQADSPYFQYRLQGRTSTANKAGEVHACIKDVYSRPYLPGSSLKGALRSILLRQRAEADSRKPVINYKHRRRGYDSRFAGQSMEKRHFMKSDARGASLPN
jgi:CRISPR-associated protein Csm5